MIDTDRPDAMQRMGVRISRDPVTGEPLPGLFLLRPGEPEPSAQSDSQRRRRQPAPGSARGHTRGAPTSRNSREDPMSKTRLNVCVRRARALRQPHRRFGSCVKSHPRFRAENGRLGLSDPQRISQAPADRRTKLLEYFEQWRQRQEEIALEEMSPSTDSIQ